MIEQGSQAFASRTGPRCARLLAIGVAIALALTACVPARGPSGPLPGVAGEESGEAGQLQEGASDSAAGAPAQTVATLPAPAGSRALTALALGLTFGAQINAPEILNADTCPLVKQLGIQAATMWLPWHEWEPQKGNFNTGRIDRVVTAFLDCGVSDLGVHFQTISDWGAGSPAPGQQAGPGSQAGARQPASRPPVDPDAFYNSVFQLASHYKGQIRRYALENEASAPGAWGGTAASYFQTLATFSRAVKAADPNATVEDSGTGGTGYGIIIASQMIQEGQAQQAADFLSQYYAHFSIGRRPVVSSGATSAQTYLNQPPIRQALARTDEWMPILYSKNASYDANQVHYYGPWYLLPRVLEYVHAQMLAGGQDRPIDIWELGYGWQDRAGYNPTAHAQDTVKLLVVAAGEGVGRIVYWPMIDKIERRTPGLVKDGQLTLAGIAYKTTVGLLAGSTSVQRVDLGNPVVWAYQFSNQGKTVYVLWGTSNATISLPVSASQVTITDIAGHTSTGDPKSIAVTASPVFLQP